MERYKYRAINLKGRQVRGVLQAANEADLYKQLQNSGLELLQSSVVGSKGSASLLSFRLRGVSVREMISLYMQFEQMQNAGIGLLETLSDIRDTTSNTYLKDIISEVYRDVSDGSSLSEAMGKHPKVFTELHLSLIQAGEETGDLVSSFRELVKYLKWVDDMQTKVRKAVRYPMVLVFVVIITVSVMMGLVVPEITSFLEEMDIRLPLHTLALIATSEFFAKYWYIVILSPLVLYGVYKLLRKNSRGFAYAMDKWFLKLPLFGELIRKISIARFAQTFGALYASGIDVLRGLESAKNTITNLYLEESVDGIIEMVKSGSSLSDSFKASGEFPSLVIRMLRIGEESGELTQTLEQVTEFYSADVDESVGNMITMIEPSLTLVIGAMLLWIAAGVFGPVYSSFETIDF